MPYRLLIKDDGVLVERVYPTFARAWDAHVDASTAGRKVIARQMISEVEYQLKRDDV
jgi:hypothetical protein